MDVHDDGHAEIVEEVGEYMEGSPLIPTEKFVRKGRSPPRRLPGSDFDAFGRRQNLSPGAACAVLPDFQTDMKFIQEDVSDLDSYINNDAIICNARIRREQQLSASPDDPYGLSDFMPRSPTSTPTDHKKLAASAFLVANGNQATGRSPTTTTTTTTTAETSKASPIPAVSHVSKAEECSADSKALTPTEQFSPAGLSCPLPVVGLHSHKQSPSASALQASAPPMDSLRKRNATAQRRGTGGGNSAASLPVLPRPLADSSSKAHAVASGVPPVMARSLANTAAPQSLSATARPTDVPVRLTVAPVSKASICSTRTTTMAAAPSGAGNPVRSPAGQTAGSRNPAPASRQPWGPPRAERKGADSGAADTTKSSEPQKMTGVRSRRNSGTDWTSGYGMPSASFLKFTGSGKLKNIDTSGNVKASSNTAASSAAAVAAPKAAESPSKSGALADAQRGVNVPRATGPPPVKGGIGSRVKAYEDAFAARNNEPSHAPPTPTAQAETATAGDGAKLNAEAVRGTPDDAASQPVASTTGTDPSADTPSHAAQTPKPQPRRASRPLPKAVPSTDGRRVSDPPDMATSSASARRPTLKQTPAPASLPANETTPEPRPPPPTAAGQTIAPRRCNPGTTKKVAPVSGPPQLPVHRPAQRTPAVNGTTNVTRVDDTSRGTSGEAKPDTKEVPNASTVEQETQGSDEATAVESPPRGHKKQNPRRHNNPKSTVRSRVLDIVEM